MSKYAEIINNKVNRVLVIDDSWTEEQAQDFLANVSSNLWVKSEKKVGKGFEYRPSAKGKILPPKPFKSWKLDSKRGMWIPPIPKPVAVPVGYIYVWVEELKQWVLEKVDEMQP